MIKKTILAILPILFGLQLYAQEYTDEEIGFDEASYRKALKEDGNSGAEINQIINQVKIWLTSTEKNKPLKTNKPEKANSSKIMATCPNIGFEDENLDDWCYRTGIYTSYSENNGYLIQYDENSEMPICTENLQEVDDYGECGGNSRISIVDEATVDPNGINLSDITGEFVLKLGNNCDGRRVDRIERTFEVTPTNTVFNYSYALALEDTGTCSHINFDIATCDANNVPPPDTHIISHQKPFFRVYLEENGERIDCSEFLVFGDDRIFSFDNTSGNVFVKDWANNSIDLLNFVNIGDNVTVVAEVADCAAGAHFGYAYFEASCGTDNQEVAITPSETTICAGGNVTFQSSEILEDHIWTLYDLDGATTLDVVLQDSIAEFQFPSIPGFYTVSYSLPDTGTTDNCFIDDAIATIEVEACDTQGDECEDCYSFKPIPNNKYILAGWVKENILSQVISYQDASIKVKYINNIDEVIGNDVFWTRGEIIEGWQQIYGEFIIPENTTTIEIVLQNRSFNHTFFDDIRVHPVNGNMKSFVYDPESQRLMAELDENNYGTFYEYDQEGGLIRVKKETERGVYTIQETRSKSSEINQN